MRLVIQRCKNASVKVNDNIVGKIGHGFLILVGIETVDTTDDAEWLANKVVQLRVFDDEQGLMNRSVLDVEGNLLVISQFTLHAKTKKGNRPSFIQAARPEVSKPLFDKFLIMLEQNMGRKVKTGVFGAHMEISLVNNGPVTIIIDSQNRE